MFMICPHFQSNLSPYSLLFIHSALPYQPSQSLSMYLSPGPLHLLIPLPGPIFPQRFIWLSSLTFRAYSYFTFSIRPPLVTLTKLVHNLSLSSSHIYLIYVSLSVFFLSIDIYLKTCIFYYFISLTDE